jgi:hypothetical protein
MSLWDFLKRNKKDVFQQYADNMQPLQPLPTVQMNEDGSSYTVENPQPMNRNRGIGLRNRLANFLLGESATPTDNANVQDGVLNVTVSENPRVGGFIPDITSGMRENFATGFAAPNLFDDTTSDGRKKGFAYRLGEGLGTAGRFLESAPGRALLTAGAVGLAGGNGADMLAYGIQGGALNNRLRTQDRMYRDEMLRNAYNSLINSPEFAAMNDEQKQTALNNLQNQVNNMRGYVTDDMYKNFVTAQQLRDNADWKRLYFDSQQEQNRIMNGLRQDQLEYQKMKAAEDRADRAAQRALTARGQDMSYGATMARIAADRENKYNKQLEKQYEKQELINGTLNQLDVLMNLHKKLPQNYVPFGSKKLTAIGSGLLNKAGLPNDDMAAFNGAANIVTNMIARKIGGEKGVMTDRDFDRAKAMTPNIYDTPSQAQAKVKAIYALMGVPYGKGGSKNNNPLGLKL